jgi:hypothetical protein
MLDLFGTGDSLTRDNSQLSEPIKKPELSISAINCTHSARTVQDYVNAAHAENTKRAYAADLAHFRSSGGTLSQPFLGTLGDLP